MKKLRMSREDKDALAKFVLTDHFVKIIEKDPTTGKERFKTTTLFLWGRECIAANMNGGKDLAGKAFIPNVRYKWENAPVYYNLKKILLDAYKTGGAEAMVNRYKQYLVDKEKMKKLDGMV